MNRIDHACAVQRTSRRVRLANRVAAAVCIACWVFLGYLAAKVV
jgi:hypothetical protein